MIKKGSKVRILVGKDKKKRVKLSRLIEKITKQKLKI